MAEAWEWGGRKGWDEVWELSVSFSPDALVAPRG